MNETDKPLGEQPVKRTVKDEHSLTYEREVIRHEEETAPVRRRLVANPNPEDLHGTECAVVSSVGRCNLTLNSNLPELSAAASRVGLQLGRSDQSLISVSYREI